MLTFLLSVALAVTPADIANPRPVGWVSDTANVISPADERALNERIDRLQTDRGAEIAVVTVDAVGSDTTPKQFATELFNAWGIGSDERDDGLLVLLVVGQRRLEMETGYGLEGALPDGWLGAMQADHMVPRFKVGDYGGGLVAGVEAVDLRLRGEALPAATGGGTRASLPAVGGLIAAIAGIWVLVGLAVTGVLAWQWRRARTCPNCHTPMTLLDEQAEDAHLTEGQQDEERVGSVQWTVYACRTCPETHTFGRTSWFTRYTECQKCGHRTRRTRREVERYATTVSGGVIRIHEDCAHCDLYTTYRRTTPRLPTHDPSRDPMIGGFGGRRGGGGGFGGFGGGGGGFGGGGGGGFGGGSSGGGGAGSSW